jgi:hypothetical protein
MKTDPDKNATDRVFKTIPVISDQSSRIFGAGKAVEADISWAFGP